MRTRRLLAMVALGWSLCGCGDEPRTLEQGTIGLGLPPNIACRPPRFGSERIDATLSDVSVEGSRSVELVRRILVRHLEQLARCAEPEWPTQPVLTGELEFVLTVTSDGGTSGTRLESLAPTLSAARACLADRIAAVRMSADETANDAVVRARVQLAARRAGEQEPEASCGAISQ